MNQKIENENAACAADFPVKNEENLEKRRELVVPQPAQETPLTIEDYPYGWRLRTKAQYYIETVDGKGQRVVFRTLNPRTGQWNSEKKSTYSDIRVLYRDTANGHIENDGLSFAYTEEKELTEFLSVFPESSLSDWQRKQLMYLRALMKTRKHFTVSIVNDPTTEQQEQIKQHEAEAKDAMPKIFAHYLMEEKAKE